MSVAGGTFGSELAPPFSVTVAPDTFVWFAPALATGFKAVGLQETGVVTWRPAPADAQMLMNGAGATFPYPIYSKWFEEYIKVDPEVRRSS